MAAVAWQAGRDEVVADNADSGMKTLVVGLGSTGATVVRHIVGLGGAVLAVDSRAEPPGLAALRAEHPDVPVLLETLDPKCLRGVDRVVLSPGLSIDIPLAIEARRQGIPVIGDIELFAVQAGAPVLAVTGSNGKSTVATLLHEILQSRGLVAPAGGNLGPPALDLLAVPKPDAYVLEISSFQMETTESLQPLGAVVLNVSPDHLDRHGSFERYASLKAKLIEHAEHAVYNWDDPVVRAMGLAHPRSIPYSVGTRLEDGYFVAETHGERWLMRGSERIVRASELGLLGGHNESNALAALALSDLLGRDDTAAAATLERFTGLPHRGQWVADVHDVRYVNDSKGTNVAASVAALAGTEGPVVLIAGGQAKGADFSSLVEAARTKLRGAVLIGEAAPVLQTLLAPICRVERATDMRAAVLAAATMAAPGDTVLLSPACASQDMFRDYRDRGDAFAAAVGGLPA